LQLGIQQPKQRLALAQKSLTLQACGFQALVQPLNLFQRLRHFVQMPRPRRC